MAKKKKNKKILLFLIPLAILLIYFTGIKLEIISTREGDINTGEIISLNNYDFNVSGRTTYSSSYGDPKYNKFEYTVTNTMIGMSVSCPTPGWSSAQGRMYMIQQIPNNKNGILYLKPSFSTSSNDGESTSCHGEANIRLYGESSSSQITGDTDTKSMPTTPIKVEFHIKENRMLIFKDNIYFKGYDIPNSSMILIIDSVCSFVNYHASTCGASIDLQDINYKEVDCFTASDCEKGVCENNACLECTTTENCNDNNPKTKDYCTENKCTHENIMCIENADCEDGNDLTVDTCVNELCSYEKIECKDDDDCSGKALAVIGYTCNNEVCTEVTSNDTTIPEVVINNTIPSSNTTTFNCTLDSECKDDDVCTTDVCLKTVCAHVYNLENCKKEDTWLLAGIILLVAVMIAVLLIYNRKR